MRFDLVPNLVVAIAVTACVSCAVRHDAPAKHDQPCVTLANARDIRETGEYDGGMHYTIADPYPGSGSIEAIAAELSRRGWRETPESVVGEAKEPGTRTWWSYHRGTDTKVYQWNGSWRNSSADMLSYYLLYEVSPINSRAVLLQVNCVYFKASTVEQLRKAAKR